MSDQAAEPGVAQMLYVRLAAAIQAETWAQAAVSARNTAEALASQAEPVDGRVAHTTAILHGLARGFDRRAAVLVQVSDGFVQ